MMTINVVITAICLSSVFRCVLDGSGSERTLDGLFRRVRCWTGRAGRSMTADAAPDEVLPLATDEVPAEPDRSEMLGAISSCGTLIRSRRFFRLNCACREATRFRLLGILFSRWWLAYFCVSHQVVVTISSHKWSSSCSRVSFIILHSDMFAGQMSIDLGSCDAGVP